MSSAADCHIEGRRIGIGAFQESSDGSISLCPPTRRWQSLRKPGTHALPHLALNVLRYPPETTPKMTTETKKYRLLTRSDFDGLVCAILLKELGILGSSDCAANHKCVPCDLASSTPGCSTFCP